MIRTEQPCFPASAIQLMLRLLGYSGCRVRDRSAPRKVRSRVPLLPINRLIRTRATGEKPSIQAGSRPLALYRMHSSAFNSWVSLKPRGQGSWALEVQMEAEAVERMDGGC